MPVQSTPSPKNVNVNIIELAETKKTQNKIYIRYCVPLSNKIEPCCEI